MKSECIQSHHYWMAKAIKLAAKGMNTTRENPRVGCVIVKNNELIGEGFHAYPGEAHAEINAIKSVKQKHTIEGCTVYVTLEPCAHTGKTPPCVDELLAIKPQKVVIAMQDPNPLVGGKSIAKLKASGIEVITTILEAEAFELNKGFIKRMSMGLPYVRIKMAMSIDGKTALKNGASQWITGSESRRDVQFLRARSCAILTGINTVLRDDPSLNVRLPREELEVTQHFKQPLRVILDTHLKFPIDAKMLRIDGDILVFTAIADKEKEQQLKTLGCQVIQLKKQSDQLDLTEVMNYLANLGINEIHTECGSTLAGALLKAQLVDEVVVYMAPKALGAQAQSLLELGELTQVDQSLQFSYQHVTRIGQDLKLELKPLYP